MTPTDLLTRFLSDMEGARVAYLAEVDRISRAYSEAALRAVLERDAGGGRG